MEVISLHRDLTSCWDLNIFVVHKVHFQVIYRLVREWTVTFALHHNGVCLLLNLAIDDLDPLVEVQDVGVGQRVKEED